MLTMTVVMLTAVGTIDMAVKAIKGSAVDVIEKPIALKKLLQTVNVGSPAASVPIEGAA